jgi:hypothetical protein
VENSQITLGQTYSHGHTTPRKNDFVVHSIIIFCAAYSKEYSRVNCEAVNNIRTLDSTDFLTTAPAGESATRRHIHAQAYDGVVGPLDAVCRETVVSLPRSF